MKHSKVIQGLVDNHTAYVGNLVQATELLQKETLSTGERSRFTGLVNELQADVVSPTLLLPAQKKGLEDVFTYAQRQAVPQKQMQPSLEPLQPSFTLDLTSTDNGAKKTPDEWFDRWANDASGKAMASAGDLYQAWKQLKRSHESGNGEEVRRVTEIRSGFHDDFDWQGKNNYLIGGTRLEYQPESLDATIIQHYKARNQAIVKENHLEIPEYLGVPIAEVVKEPKGLRYMQVLFDTDDDSETIMETLEFVSGKQRSEIKIWTPPLKSSQWRTRKETPNRAAGFYFNGGSFHVDGGGINYRGRSRGVAVE